MTKVALRIFSIKLLKITYQIAKLINGKNPRAKTEERKMANTSVIVIPEGKICDYVDGKFRNDTPEEYVRQTIEKRLVNEHKYLPKQIRIEYTLQLGSRKPRADIVIFDKDCGEQTQENIKIIIECSQPRHCSNHQVPFCLYQIRIGFPYREKFFGINVHKHIIKITTDAIYASSTVCKCL